MLVSLALNTATSGRIIAFKLPEVAMRARSYLVCLVILAAACFAVAKNKQALPNNVLKAQTVMVVIQPEAGEPVTNPTANRTAQVNVEQALSQWGRFRLVSSADFADLVIAVRKGYSGGPTVANSPVDNAPVTIQTGGETTRVGVQQGQPADLTHPPARPADAANRVPGQPPGPRPAGEVGSPEDSFEVYQGGVQYPLDAPPIWRHRGKDALDAPKVRAVEEFRKAIADSEKAQKQKP
jgi:hypothetical protein